VPQPPLALPVVQKVVWLLVKHFFRQPCNRPYVACLFAVGHAVSLQQMRQLVRSGRVADVLLQRYLTLPAARRACKAGPLADKTARYWLVLQLGKKRIYVQYAILELGAKARVCDACKADQLRGFAPDA
jgi:hypothetical protein